MEAAAHGDLAALRQAALAVDGRLSAVEFLRHQLSMADAAPTLSDLLDRPLLALLWRPVRAAALAGRCSSRLSRARACALVDVRPPLRADTGRDEPRVGHALEAADARVEAGRVEAARVAAEAGREAIGNRVQPASATSRRVTWTVAARVRTLCPKACASGTCHAWATRRCVSCEAR